MLRKETECAVLEHHTRAFVEQAAAASCKLICSNEIAALRDSRIPALGSERAPLCAMRAGVNCKESDEDVLFF
jgi:hypothetical protein